VNLPLTSSDAWRSLLALRAGQPQDTFLLLPGGWRLLRPLDAEAAQLVALMMPALAAPADRPYVIAHLAQSLDGRIATSSGASQWITGPEDLTHCHRLRAICDAVLVGAETAALDRPRLTVRRVEGPQPLRVVLDPGLRLPAEGPLFSGAQTLRICTLGAPGCEGPGVLALPAEEDGNIPPAAILEALHARGVARLYIEGGGVTVSSFLRDGLLDRLHVAVAPVLIGSGRPSLQLPQIDSLAGTLRPAVARYPIGADTLFDLDLRSGR
jgi:diaminohydroxyphosphoribosylaminopyrimidine deaminase/5-amino-6-(5-phosphoribosylamino)uracil reductase